MNWINRIRYWWRKRVIRGRYPDCKITIISGDEMLWGYSTILVRMFRGYEASWINYWYAENEGDFRVDMTIRNVEDFKKVMDVWKILVPNVEAILEYGLSILITI